MPSTSSPRSIGRYFSEGCEGVQSEGAVVSRDRITTTVVARFHYRHEAELAHGYLESAGVDSALHVDDAGGMDVGLAFVNPARIVVRAEDEERARQVLVDAGMLD